MGVGDLCALVAQSVEHIHGKDEVNGSIPFEGYVIAREGNVEMGRAGHHDAHPFACSGVIAWSH